MVIVYFQVSLREGRICIVLSLTHARSVISRLVPSGGEFLLVTWGCSMPLKQAIHDATLTDFLWMMVSQMVLHVCNIYLGR